MQKGKKIKGHFLLSLLLFLLFFCSAQGGNTNRELYSNFIDRIEAVSKKAELTKNDCVMIAQSTIDLGKKNKLPPGVIEDGIKAVELGKMLDPNFPYWESYLKELLKLLEENASSSNMANKKTEPAQNQKEKNALSEPISESNLRKRGMDLKEKNQGFSKDNLSLGKNPSAFPSSKKEQKESTATSESKQNQNSPLRPDNSFSDSENSTGEETEKEIKLRQIKQLDNPSTFFKRMRQIESETNDSYLEDPDW
ncbi:hypothetical protein A7K93_03790 [Candidatus Methylacidiphilum fumarolicum]|uniref:hypothetical protein n=1 Tax=Candidatus Methylacidiphilum fumarolicum TaxID=591154 RepID=UPI0002F4E3F9|nr:hypothetical protein [Candidatus Methylacidiphilum fumarolicum]TFE70347.1 hypothetical protein A7K73_04025 [Candidatus Methylacidiphilum fumarolicum]TFE73972.1 hypothetical protein A7K72_05130 [Candidatus Methylacidiphilum fumarolicum]TFE74479.1 hypothetical protein A7K93_03790 [Candidatus Methylacidiphilum fumarolicum]TFE77860.1 hypothetical protein A7D33_02595 [Candidatus Methylacidiphilum fumarolicum]